MKLVRLSLMCLLSAGVITSCVKKKFDNPPDSSQVDPHLPVTATIRNLSDLVFSTLPSPGNFRVLGDTTIAGIVVGDDRSGNIYKQIFIQDSSGGGMAILLDRSNLYGDYPVGRRVYVKTKGLYLTNYKGLPEIVYSVDATGSTSGIPTALMDNFIVKGSFPHKITPPELTIEDLKSNPYQYLNTLVTLKDMQFDEGSAGVVYSAANANTNRTITNCSRTANIVMYNSSYSLFRGALTPTGNGSITGIITIYISTPQFTLRDTTDINFKNPRCPQ